MNQGIEERQAEDFLKTYYGVTATSIKALHGYDEQNFLVCSKAQGKTPSHVFKVVNDPSKPQETLQEISAILHRLSSNGLKVPHVVKSLSGSYIECINFGSERKSYLLWLLTFIPGIILEDLNLNQKQLDSIAFECGVKFAQINRQMLEVELNLDLKRPDYKWNIGNIKFCKSTLGYIDDRQLKNAIVEIDKTFDACFTNNLQKVRRGLIHGDGNAANIIVTATENNESDKPIAWQVAGIIDFSDVMDNPLVFEIATLMAYMMNLAWQNNLNYQTVASNALSGYISVLPLDDNELEALHISVLKRMAMSVCASAHESYLGAHEQKLKDLRSMSSLIKALWKKNWKKELFKE